MKRNGFLGRLIIATALLAVATSWRIGVPSLWSDEVATIAATNRGFGNLFHMLGNIDAVHGTYYFIMHFFGKIAGFTPFAIRLPSALAATATAAVVALIGFRQYGERLGWFAFLTTALMPRLVWSATEARSYAFTALFAALLILVLLMVLDAEGKRRKWLWVSYTFVLALSIHIFIYLILIAFSQGLWVFWRSRAAFKQWLLSLGIAVAIAGYVITMVIIEKGQVGWLPAIGTGTPMQVFVEQAFWGNPPAAVFCDGLILAVIGGAVHYSRRLDAAKNQFVQQLAIIITLPTLAVVGYSLVSTSIYDSRYFTMTAPAVALLVAIACDQLFAKKFSFIALALALALCAPSFVHFRQLNSKGTTWSPIASALAKNSKPGDGILFTDFDKNSPSQSRILIGYAKELKNFTDLTLKTPYWHAQGLYPKRYAIEQVTSRFAGHARILVLEVASQAPEFARVSKVLVANGYTETKRIKVERNYIDIFTKN